MPAVTSGELALLRRKTQRYRLYFVKWDTWQIRQNVPLLYIAATPTTEAGSKNLGVDQLDDFSPIVNIGSNRMAFVGEAITFDSSRSFAVHNAGILPTPQWTFQSGSPSTYSGTSVDVTWSTPGLYEVTCSINETTAQRYVRVFADRSSITYDVINVSGISGSLNGGWKAQVTIAPSNDTAGVSSQTINLGDFQAVGVFMEEEWVASNGSVTRRPISGYPHDERLLVSGYVQQGSIRVDANTHQVSFTIASVADQMNNSMINGTSTFSKQYLDSESQLEDSKVPGITLDMSPYTMVQSDHILWWTQRYTNILDRHDFTTWYDSSQQEMDNITTNEGTIWSGWSSLCDNEWAYFFADPGGGLHFEPNPSIRSAGWFESQYPVRMTFTDADMVNIQVQERKMRNVIFARIFGVRVRDGQAFQAEFPDGGPPSGAGQWYIKSGLNASRQSFFDHIIENIYLDQNRKITAVISTAMNRAIRVPDRVLVTYAEPARNINWTSKEFYVDSVTYNLNPAQSVFTSQISIKEVV